MIYIVRQAEEVRSERQSTKTVNRQKLDPQNGDLFHLSVDGLDRPKHFWNFKNLSCEWLWWMFVSAKRRWTSRTLAWYSWSRQRTYRLRHSHQLYVTFFDEKYRTSKISFKCWRIWSRKRSNFHKPRVWMWIRGNLKELWIDSTNTEN